MTLLISKKFTNLGLISRFIGGVAIVPIGKATRWSMLGRYQPPPISLLATVVQLDRTADF